MLSVDGPAAAGRAWGVEAMGQVVDDERVAAAGLDAVAVQGLVDRARREVDAGLLPSCQLALARDGEVVVDVTLGDAGPDDRFVVFSCTKAVTAAGIWRLLSDGRLRTDTRVADVLDGFGANGKDAVTVEHLLTHTAGFPHAPLALPLWHDRAGRLERYRSWRTTWEPGTRFEYHPTSAHWVLADVLAEVTGEDHRSWIRANVLEPLGLRRLQLGTLPGEPPVACVPVEVVGERPSADELAAVLGPGIDLDELAGEVTDDAKVLIAQPDVLATGLPGGGAVSTAADLARLYQAFLHDPLGLWDPEVLRLGTVTVLCDLPDPWKAIPSNRTLGLMLAGDDGHAALRGFGKTCSPRAFGHDGAGGQIAFADPASGLSFSYLTGGHDRDVLREWRRTTALASRATTCA